MEIIILIHYATLYTFKRRFKMLQALFFASLIASGPSSESIEILNNEVLPSQYERIIVKNNETKVVKVFDKSIQLDGSEPIQTFRRIVINKEGKELSDIRFR